MRAHWPITEVRRHVLVTAPAVRTSCRELSSQSDGRSARNCWPLGCLCGLSERHDRERDKCAVHDPPVRGGRNARATAVGRLARKGIGLAEPM